MQIIYHSMCTFFKKKHIPLIYSTILSDCFRRPAKRGS